MKKIFLGIGLLVGAFSVFFFLLVADKDVYFNDDTVYDFSLSKNISGEKLTQIASETNMMIRLVKFNDISFGRNHLDVTLLNPTSDVKLGRQPSIFPGNQIIYSSYSPNEKKKIKYFTIQSNDEHKVNHFKEQLSTAGYEMVSSTSEPTTFNISMLFSSLNFKFFSLLTLLILFSISTYYIHRIKEIGIKKLNGWNNFRISFSLIKKLVIHSFGAALLFVLPFAVYISVTDLNALKSYALMCIYLYLFLAIIFIGSSIIGSLFISRLNQVNAIKNNKNNKKLFYVLLFFKAIVVTLLVLSLDTSIKDMNKLNSSINSINQLEKNTFYKVQTASSPEEKVHKELDHYIESLNDEDIFNYSPSDETVDINQLKQLETEGMSQNLENIPLTIVSQNILNVVKIKDQDGSILKSDEVQPFTLLVPAHYEKNIKEVLQSLSLGKKTKVHYVKNGQTQENLLWPGSYLFDTITYVAPLQKSLYLNSGEVLFDTSSATALMKEIESKGYDSGSIDVKSMKSEYNLAKGNLSIATVESLFHVIITGFSFLLCILSIITIFLEFRKKEFAVNRLLGKRPKSLIMSFLIFNGVITLLIAAVINWMLIILFLIEMMLFVIFINKYMKNKAILVLKGE
ncbi:hypothetical protein [Exiguobacterium undae]|uniref:Bacteriocin-associated integral membrane protein n=1 Tax=Exiguobacterium undae TaxID=169177 RepID=A0ABX2VBR1_9BACL|nr:hypothetical protein [Exiguobacterium undae]OAN15678.1 hypothetical protein A3783_07020 [Exiguobacterium undae]